MRPGAAGTRLAAAVAAWVEEGGPPRGVPLWKAVLLWLATALTVTAAVSAVGYAFFWDKWQPVRRYEADARAWERAVRRDPADVGAWLNLGWARFQLGRLEGAEAALRQARRLEPGDPVLDYYLGLVLAERAARSAPAGAAGAAGRGGGAAGAAGQASVRGGRREGEAGRAAVEAERLLRGVFELFPDNPLPAFRLAELYVRTGRPAEAVELLDDIVERLDPTLADVYALRGRAREALREPEAARQDYLRALSLDPSLGEVREALRRLGVPEESLPPVPMSPRSVRPAGGGGWETLWYRR